MEHNKMRKKIWIKGLIWLLFSVIGSLLPFFINSSYLSLEKKVFFVDIFGEGGLFLVSTTLCLVSMGELMGIDYKDNIRIKSITILFVFCSILIIIFTTISYIFTLQHPLDKEILIKLAHWLFFVSAFFSTLSILFTEWAEILNSQGISL